MYTARVDASVLEVTPESRVTPTLDACKYKLLGRKRVLHLLSVCQMMWALSCTCRVAIQVHTAQHITTTFHWS